MNDKQLKELAKRCREKMMILAVPPGLSEEDIIALQEFEIYRVLRSATKKGNNEKS